MGGLNILINNAQVIPLSELHQVSDEAFAAGFESGPLATFRLMKLCYPHLKGDGSIVNLATSAAKRRDMSAFGAYAALLSTAAAAPFSCPCTETPVGSYPRSHRYKGSDNGRG